MLPTLRADFRLVQTYTYRDEPPLTTPISVFGGIDDQDVSEMQLEEWRRHTTARFTLTMMSGGHLFLRGEAPSLLQAIREQLSPLSYGSEAASRPEDRR